MAIPLHTTSIDLPQKNRVDLVTILNKSLASANDLYAQFKQAHWNIKGDNFIALHKLLDELAENIENQVDIIAERITSLGGTALGTIQETEKNSSLKEYPTDIFQAKDHLTRLAHNIAMLAEKSRTDIKTAENLGDMGTSDIYIALVKFLDKSLWFIEAHTQK